MFETLSSKFDPSADISFDFDHECNRAQSDHIPDFLSFNLLIGRNSGQRVIKLQPKTDLADPTFSFQVST